MMAYYKVQENDKNVQVKHAIIGVTDDPKKDAVGVKAFEDAAINIVQSGEGSPLKTIHEFTDGCASQYKGKNAFMDIASRASPAVTRNFYETSDGKSVCDGLGAIVKRSCYQAVISGKAVIRDAHGLMEYCEGRLSISSKRMVSADGTVYLSKRQFVFIEQSKLDRKNRPIVNTIKGTRKFHYVRASTPGCALQVKSLSCYCGCQHGGKCK